MLMAEDLQFGIFSAKASFPELFYTPDCTYLLPYIDGKCFIFSRNNPVGSAMAWKRKICWIQIINKWLTRYTLIAKIWFINDITIKLCYRVKTRVFILFSFVDLKVVNRSQRRSAHEFFSILKQAFIIFPTKCFLLALKIKLSFIETYIQHDRHPTNNKVNISLCSEN